MNQKKKQEKNKFSKFKLRSTCTKSKKSVSPHINSRETISKYFSSMANDNNTENESEIIIDSATESQCAQILPSNLNIETSLRDDNDFIETQNVKKPKVIEIKNHKVSKVPKKRKIKNDLSRFIKNTNSSVSDTNQEHLHMALAMSKSLEEFQNSGQKESEGNVEYSNSYPSTQEKQATIKRTLDQFGFKSERNPIEIPTLKNNIKQKKKLKHITPTLFLRTDEDRLKLIESKVSGILTNISVFYNNIAKSDTLRNNEDEILNNKPRSFLLRDYYDEDSTIFKKNYLKLSLLEDSKFYNNIVPKEEVKVGVLLKDWASIPGRERSPPANIVVEETENYENETNTSMNRSISPDLFSESDLELSINKPSISKNDSFKNINNIDSSIKLVKSLNKLQCTVHDSNTEIELDKEICSDDSDSKSLSLLDSISPQRNKSKFARKNHSSAKKTLFADETSSLKMQNVRKSISPIFSRSPIKTYENDTEICHFESFYDNSNEIFDLTQSSDGSDGIFDRNTIIATENCDALLTHSNIQDHEPLIDLTQSSKDSKKTEENDLNCHFQKTILTNKNLSLSENDEFDKDTVILQKKLDKDDSSNISVDTVLLTTNIKDVENSNDSVETVLLQSKHANEIERSAQNTENEFSPEFDVMNSTNNKEFYDSLNKTSLSVFTELEDTKISSEIIFDNTSHSPTESKLCRKSLSENVSPIRVDVTDFFKISSPLNITKISDNKYSPINENINKSPENINIHDKDDTENIINTPKLPNYNVSQSSADTNSDISDEELNYSTNNSFRIQKLNVDTDHCMEFNDLPYNQFEPSHSFHESFNHSITQETLKHPRVKILCTPNKFRRSFSEPTIMPNDQSSKKTPENSKNNVISITPNNDYIIKTTDVTPMPNYEEMDTPKVIEELDKFGIKPLKRAKGIQLLQYLYEATHPVLRRKVEKVRMSSSDEDNNTIIKRRKRNTCSESIRISEHYKETSICSEIANSENDEDMIFERKQSVKIASCRLPLHIAWYNLVSSSQELHEKILLYEPIQIEEIYAKFKSFGFKFHIQDIITFLDKKCITIKIAQNQKKTAS